MGLFLPSRPSNGCYPQPCLKHFLGFKQVKYKYGIKILLSHFVFSQWEVSLVVYFLFVKSCFGFSELRDRFKCPVCVRSSRAIECVALLLACIGYYLFVPSRSLYSSRPHTAMAHRPSSPIWGKTAWVSAFLWQWNAYRQARGAGSVSRLCDDLLALAQANCDDARLSIVLWAYTFGLCQSIKAWV